uniref:K-box domain-containing protein n=1 Tax=Ananas comosus var. bracteatus TaxID=296719 RepID=A0A6V7Q346_ANACO|nr:unnamed protein product [Ananas comosus var. bracteatus]
MVSHQTVEAPPNERLFYLTLISNLLKFHSMDWQFWQREAASLRQQLQDLHKSNRRLIGEELSDLTVKDLQGLEKRVEMSLCSIRKTKEKILRDEIAELNRKGYLVHNENIELHKKANLVYQENIELNNKVREASGSSGGTTKASIIPFVFTVAEDEEELVHLQLCHPQPQGDRT